MDLTSRLISGLIFPMHERLKGHDTVALRRALEDSQWYAPDALRALQWRRLHALLIEVGRRVPFYREFFRAHGLRPERWQDFADLQRLPIVDKALIRAQGARWRAENAPRLVAASTSGSTGEPLRFWLSWQRQSMDIAAKWRATRWWDVDIGDRELVVWGAPIEVNRQDFLKNWRDRLLRSRLLPAQQLSTERLDTMLDTLRRWRPRMLFGYPSVLARLAWHAQARGLALADRGMRVAFVTSEVLQPEWRAVIGTVFGCGVANEYGARDAGFIARECPAGGWHITAESVLLETVDEHGCPVPPGAPGELLVTNLVGAEFPFIRYRTGDRGRLDPTTRCPCGRGLPLLAELAGRANDGLLAVTGAWVHGSAFNYLVRGLPGLRAYQIVQEQLERVEVHLALAAGPLALDTERTIAAGIRHHLGPTVAVVFNYAPELAAAANGKYRHVICRIAR